MFLPNVVFFTFVLVSFSTFAKARKVPVIDVVKRDAKGLHINCDSSGCAVASLMKDGHEIDSKKCIRGNASFNISISTFRGGFFQCVDRGVMSNALWIPQQEEIFSDKNEISKVGETEETQEHQNTTDSGIIGIIDGEYTIRSILLNSTSEYTNNGTDFDLFLNDSGARGIIDSQDLILSVLLISMNENNGTDLGNVSSTENLSPTTTTIYPSISSSTSKIQDTTEDLVTVTAIGDSSTGLSVLVDEFTICEMVTIGLVSCFGITAVFLIPSLVVLWCRKRRQSGEHISVSRRLDGNDYVSMRVNEIEDKLGLEEATKVKQ